MSYPYWDIPSALFYLMQGIIAAIALRLEKQKEYKISYIRDGYVKLVISPYIAWGIIWTFFATFRLVDNKIGGADAVSYKKFFEICLDDYIPAYYEHYDVLYKLINCIIRLITNNYHVFFMIIYGFMVFAIIFSVNEFCPAKTRTAPFIVSFLWFLSAYNTIRSSLGEAVILISLVLLHRGKWKSAMILAFSTFFIQKACLVYALFVPFYLIIKRIKLTPKRAIVLVFVSIVLCRSIRDIFINFASSVELNGAYVSYAKRSLSISFFSNYWKIAFTQLLLAFFMLFFFRQLERDRESMQPVDNERLSFVWNACVFDIALIPVSYILGIWRAPQFFMPIRMIMWGEMIRVCENMLTVPSRKIFNFMVVAVCIAWFLFRAYNIYEDSCLMPYILDLL